MVLLEAGGRISWPELQVEIPRETCVYMPAELTAAAVPSFYDEVHGRLDVLATPQLVIDCSNSGYLDPGVLGVFVSARLRARSMGRLLVLRDPTAAVTDALELTDLAKTFTFKSTTRHRFDPIIHAMLKL